MDQSYQNIFYTGLVVRAIVSHAIYLGNFLLLNSKETLSNIHNVRNVSNIKQLTLGSLLHINFQFLYMS